MNDRTEPPERHLLRHSWDRLDAETLDSYLVAGVEDPRINVQSILTRALLCDTLFPASLIDEELRFGFAMTWLTKQLEQGTRREAISSAIAEQPATVCPGFILDTARRLQRGDSPCGDYLRAALETSRSGASLTPESLDTFQNVWHERLNDRTHNGHSLFEPACGSANDYRYIASFGIGRFVRYTGVDIATKNIANARRRFPDVDFRVGDLCDTRFADQAFDFSFVHDLFEHLSPEAMQRAIEELLRVTRYEAWLHFFNCANMSEHQVRKVGSYHWNTLSVGKLMGLIERSARRVEIVSIADLARAKFGFDDYYNAGAYTIIATR